MVGATRFEHATLWSQTRCSTRLSYAPMTGGKATKKKVPAAFSGAPGSFLFRQDSGVWDVRAAGRRGHVHRRGQARHDGQDAFPDADALPGTAHRLGFGLDFRLGYGLGA